MLDCSVEAGSPLFQALAHCHAKLVDCCCNHHQIMVEAHSSSVDTPECSECCHSGSHDHSILVTDCCQDHRKMGDCCRNHKVDIQQCKCYEQLNDDAVETVANIFCAKQLNKKQYEVTDHDYLVCQDLHLITREGSNYPYNICYMAFSLKQTKNAKSLIHAGADFLEDRKSTSLPSYLLEYCTSGRPDYLSWLLNTLSSDKLEKLIEHIGARYMTRDCINYYKSHYGRNIAHSLLLSGNEHIVKKIVQKITGCDLLKETDSMERTALHIAAKMGVADSVNVLLEM